MGDFSRRTPHYLAAYHWTATELECGNFQTGHPCCRFWVEVTRDRLAAAEVAVAGTDSAGRDNFYGGGGGTSNWSTGGGSSGSHKDGWNCDKNGKNCHLTITVYPGGTETSFSKGGAEVRVQNDRAVIRHSIQLQNDVCQKIVLKGESECTKCNSLRLLQIRSLTDQRTKHVTVCHDMS
ncbi:hypothetical protein Bealeia2_02044 (plasmid) [Candidatus Bealeia paramacronuclearis]|nr:hypothetical protein [Candidatus Bealeia paramacronuclearis]